MKAGHTMTLDEARAEVARLSRVLAVARVEHQLLALGLPPVCSAVAAKRSLEGVAITSELDEAGTLAAFERALAFEAVIEMARLTNVVLPKQPDTEPDAA